MIFSVSIVCPTITANNQSQYEEQMGQISGFAKRIHIDLMDGDFATTISPNLDQIWWPPLITADIHLMYRRPMDYLEKLIKLRPHMVIIHNEAEVHHMHFASELHKENILVGLAVLQDTPIEHAYQIMHSFDQVLVFSGHLGFHGGQADLGLLDKVNKIKSHHHEAEVAWDGGINDQNANTLVSGGVDVLNVGGFIQTAEDPKAAYATLVSLV
jgi:ribulose-phosphate 3-epimerase